MNKLVSNKFARISFSPHSDRAALEHSSCVLWRSVLPGGSSFSGPDPPDSTERFSKDWKTDRWKKKKSTMGRMNFLLKARYALLTCFKQALSEPQLPLESSYKTRGRLGKVRQPAKHLLNPSELWTHQGNFSYLLLDISGAVGHILLFMVKWNTVSSCQSNTSFVLNKLDHLFVVDG